MRSRSNNNDSTRTSFIQLDTKKCIACWECITECKNNVIGRINLPWHKHSKFVNSKNCIGCLKCINVCEPNALTKISSEKPESNSMRATRLALFVNIGLLIIGLAMSISGFLIQFKYHMGHNHGLESFNSVPGPGYYGWTGIHKISVILFSVLMTYHILIHLIWYKTIIIKKLFARNRLQITLSIVLILAVITGYIPWIINLSGGSETARKSIIEIHDKIAVLLFVLLTIHLKNRIKWYLTTLDKLKNKQST